MIKASEISFMFKLSYTFTFPKRHEICLLYLKNDNLGLDRVCASELCSCTVDRTSKELAKFASCNSSGLGFELSCRITTQISLF